MIRIGGLLLLDGLKTGVLPGRLVEVRVNADIAFHQEGRSHSQDNASFASLS
jgi:hypothetical protein